MTQPNHQQQPDYFGGPEWPSESHAQGGFDQFGQPVTAHPYQAPDPYSNHSDPSGEDHRRPHVDFGRAVKLFFKNYAVFNGRASRSEYWWIFLFSILVEMILNAINFAMDGTPNDPARLYAVLSTIWFLGTLIPSIAIGVRRLHDTNHTGWWLLISLIPVIGWIWVLVYLVQDSDENAWQSYDKEPLPVTDGSPRCP